MATQDNVIEFDCFWDDEYKHLEYVVEPFNNSQDTQRWTTLGYWCKFTGAMCDMRRRQPSWNTKFIDYFSVLGWKDVCTSYYKMETCTILPVHQDTYKRYAEIYQLHGKEHSIKRAVIFLEDWHSGHYIELNGQAYTGWRKGFCLHWSYDEPHMAANIGLNPRYTLQVTGHI